MSIKKLVEKKNALIAEAESMLDVCAEEVRALNTEENEAYEAKQKEIEEISKTIKLMEARAKAEAEVEVVETKIEKEEVRMEERNVNVEELEVRALADYMRGKVTDEVRAISTSTTGAVVPTHLYGEVIKKLEEVAPLFSMVPKLTPVAGSLEILKEKELGAAAFVGEATNLNLTDYSFEKVKLEQKRAGSAVELSQHLINDSGIDIVGYTKDILFRRLGYALDRCMVNGDGTTQFQGLDQAPETCKVKAAAAELSIDDFMNVLNAMNPELQRDAVWVMSRDLFNAVALLKDGVGNYYITRQLNVVDNKPQYRLLGLPVFINDAVDKTITGAADKKICYLVNFAEAYKGMIKKGMELKQISGDTANALKGTQTFTLDMYADCKIVNEAAVRYLATVMGARSK